MEFNRETFFEDFMREELTVAYEGCKYFGEDEKLEKALRKVIRFYSTPTEWKEWKEAHEFD